MTGDVAVVGAGVAGLAAAVALAKDGVKVTLLERRPMLGGRAYSYEHPALVETIDSQHVVLGCCTNLVDLMEQAGAADSIRWYDELCFIEPATAWRPPRRSWMRPGKLPAPLQQAESFLRAPMLGLRDKAAIALGLARFLRGYPENDAESFAAWLKRTGQTKRAIRHFWEPVVVGALNDEPQHCSVKYAGKVFYESFLRSAAGGRLGVPVKPLSEFFAPVAKLASRRGATVRMGTAVDEISQIPGGGWRLRGPGVEIMARTVILATPRRETYSLMKRLGGVAGSRFELDWAPLSPITTVHLWFDSEIVDVDHAVLLDTRVQWMFSKSRIRGWEELRGSYLELVISASWAELELGREAILASALKELEMFFPNVREARLVKSAVLKEAKATFSVVPKLDGHRPPQTTAYPGLFVAGDWTATEWPSTMEGAARSGRLAAGEVVGDRQKFTAQELPVDGLMRLLAR